MANNIRPHRNHRKLQRLLESSSSTYEDMRDLLKEDPMVLTSHGEMRREDDTEYTYPPLTEAIRKNNIGHVKAILEVLGNKETGERILARYRNQNRIKKECPLEHPFYVTADMGSSEKFLPHAFATNPEMIQLLHDHGYNLNAWENGNRTSLIDRYIEYQILPNSQLVGSPFENIAGYAFEPVLRKAIELGMDLNSRKFINQDGKLISTAEFAYTQAAWTLTSKSLHNENPDIFADFIKLLARNGIDCRDIMTMHLTDILAEDMQEILEQNRNGLKRYFKAAVDDYTKAMDYGKRGNRALISCAGGTFPALLAACAEIDKGSGDTKQTDELLSYLPPYWQDQYKNVIHTTEATLARKSPVNKDSGKSELSKYLKNGRDPSQRGAH